MADTKHVGRMLSMIEGEHHYLLAGISRVKQSQLVGYILDNLGRLPGFLNEACYADHLADVAAEAARREGVREPKAGERVVGGTCPTCGRAKLIAAVSDDGYALPLGSPIAKCPECLAAWVGK